MKIRQGIAALTFSCAGIVSAQELSLSSPIDCDLTRDCYIQQYVDRDPSERAKDYRCAPLSYDGHKGTDFALGSPIQMQAGVRVLAAAGGTVTGIRDGMPDTGVSGSDPADLAGRECGNGVVIDHGDGWETQYCHMRQGSIVANKGQKVVAGDPLGMVGQSGQAEFAHVHLSVRRDGAVIDPFDPEGAVDCSAPLISTLWAAPPPYRAGGLLEVGFADHVPDFATIRSGNGATDALSMTSPALVIFGYTFGTRQDDVMLLSITGPQGVVISDAIRLERTQAQAFRAIGKRRASTPWPAGTYTGTATLMRGKEKVDQRITTKLLE